MQKGRPMRQRMCQQRMPQDLITTYCSSIHLQYLFYSCDLLVVQPATTCDFGACLVEHAMHCHAWTWNLWEHVNMSVFRSTILESPAFNVPKFLDIFVRFSERPLSNHPWHFLAWHHSCQSGSSLNVFQVLLDCLTGSVLAGPFLARGITQ